MHYAGIGARKTPDDILGYMNNAAHSLASMGWTLRSGGAAGADSAFEAGCDRGLGDKEIFLPWRGFRGNTSPLYGSTKTTRMEAKKYHPNWNALSSAGWEFMARNTQIALGKNLDDPVKFIICWTEDGKIVGGTGHALRIAEAYNIPVLNMAVMSLTEMEDVIKQLIEENSSVP